MTTIPILATTSSDPGFTHRVLALALGLGLAANLLLKGEILLGPGFALWMTGFGVASSYLASLYRPEHRNTVVMWSVIASSAAAFLVLRNSPAVILPMVAVILIAAAMVIMELGGTRLSECSVSQQIIAAFRTPIQALAGAVPVLGRVKIGGGDNRLKLHALVRGAVIALPLILIFGSLFSQADAGFERFATGVLDTLSFDLPEQLVVTLVFAWLSAGLLAALGSDKGGESIRPRRLALGQIELLIVMATLTGLFVTFVALQMPYLFGGRETIANSSGLTLAEYARRGFFELVVVSVLALGLLLLLASAVSRPRHFRLLGEILIACIFVILFSALQRLFLYVEAFGMTLSRLSALVCMVWLAVSLGLFHFTVLNADGRGFAPGLTITGIVLALVLALLNPAWLVAKINIDRGIAENQEIDAVYLKELGAEAIPLLIEHRQMFSPADRCFLSSAWLAYSYGRGETAGRAEGRDWRYWNLAQSRALDAIAENEMELREYLQTVCPRIGPLSGRFLQ